MEDSRRGIVSTKQETSQTINLSNYLGRDPLPVEREIFVEKAIDKIIERTQSGKSIHGKSFRQYSKEYAEEKGVPRSQVDLTEDGDMMLAIRELAQSDSRSVKFGYEAGTQALKAFNHNTGDTLPKRRFFGLRKSEIQEIINDIRDTPPLRPQAERTQQKLDQAERILSNLLDSITLQATRLDRGN